MLGFDEITSMADRINLPQIVIDRAKYLLKMLNDRKALRGRSYYAKATACLYIACRQENTPRTYKEICAISNSSKKEIGRCFKLILRALSTTAVRSVDSSDFILRFCSNLSKFGVVYGAWVELDSKNFSPTDLPKAVEGAALKISKEIAKLNQIDGRSPVSIAAAAIYFACEVTDNQQSHQQICKVCGVSMTTLDTMCRILRNHESYSKICNR